MTKLASGVILGAATEAVSMKLARSPNYPSQSLKQALDAVKKLYDSEKRTPVSHEAAALAMGYTMLSGNARSTIAALRQYGLITKAEKGHLRVSDRAITILLADTDKAREEALKPAALAPELFAELAKTHAEASENAITQHLMIKKGFTADGARSAAKAFRETLALAKIDASGYNANGDEEMPEDMIGNETGQPNDGGGKPAAGKPADGMFALNVPYAKGTISVQVRVTGEAISPTHLARVRKYLELAESEWDGDE